MEAKTLLNTTPRFAHRPIQIVLVRANGPLFYSVAAAALLEAVVPPCADRLLRFCGADAVISGWIQTEWLPGKEARAKELREYVEATWPEIDWGAACEQYRESAEAQGGLTPRRGTAAHEALARCVAAAQSGIFYRTLARWADDPRLREMARRMAQDEAGSFARFRAIYERQARTQRFGFAAAWRTALACVRTARDMQLPLIFDALSAQCGGQVPFPVLEYGEFIARMRAVIERHGQLGTPERILFRSWKARPRVRLPKKTPPAGPAWFKPLFQAAA